MEKLNALERATDDRLELINTMEGFSEVLKDMKHLCLQEKEDVKEAQESVVKKYCALKSFLEEQEVNQREQTTLCQRLSVSKQTLHRGIQHIYTEKYNQAISDAKGRLARLGKLENALKDTRSSYSAGSWKLLSDWMDSERSVCQIIIDESHLKIPACGKIIEKALGESVIEESKIEEIHQRHIDSIYAFAKENGVLSWMDDSDD